MYCVGLVIGVNLTEKCARTVVYTNYEVIHAKTY